MSKVIAFANQKGGVGKTTLAFNFAALLATKGYKVILIDLDSQANLTTYFGVKDPAELTYTVGHAMKEAIEDDEVDLASLRIIKNRAIENLGLLGANNQLYQIKQVLMDTIARESILRTVVEPLKEVCDYVIIDCAPSLDIDLLNALVAADEVMIVATPSPFSYTGSEELMKSIGKVKKRLNPDLRIAGVICNKVDRRNNFMPEMLSAMRENWKGTARVFDTEIPNSVRVDESQCESLALINYEKNNAVTKACGAFVDEYLRMSEETA